MASPNAVSIVRELGVREYGQSGALALFGPGDHAAPYPSGCAKNWASQSESAGILFGTPIRHCFDLLVAELKIMQELLRHSTIRVTLDTYTQAVTTEKRNAQDAAVALLFPGKTQET